MKKYSLIAEGTAATNTVELKSALSNKLNEITSWIQQDIVSKARLLILLACISIPWQMNVFAQSGGNGSTGNPFRISNMTDWEWFATDGYQETAPNNHFRLTADIGCEDDPVTQMVVGGFAGTFDGNGRTVWVRIESVGVSVGLFSTIDENTTIRDLSVRGLINNKNYFQEYADTEK